MTNDNNGFNDNNNSNKLYYTLRLFIVTVIRDHNKRPNYVTIYCIPDKIHILYSGQ